MQEYTVLTEDEKLQIKEATVRNLEFMMYQLDLQLVAEGVKDVQDAALVEYLNLAIAEKQAQIAAIQ
jgi:hypothetical protein